MEWLRRVTNSPIAVACFALLVYAIFLGTYLAARHNDISILVAAGTRGNPAETPRNLTVSTESEGYDGQFFYGLSLNPFPASPTVHGITLDNPAYRQQRLGYPLLVWIFSAGQPLLVIYLMPLLNLIALALLGWIGARMSMLSGHHPLWGLILPLYPGFLLSLMRDLSEIMAVLFLTASLYALARKQNRLAALFLAYGALTRETVLMVPLLLAMLDLLAIPFKRERRFPVYVYSIPIAVFGFWSVFLRMRWGHFPASSTANAFTTPFAAFLEFFDRVSWRRTHLDRFFLGEAVYMVLFTILAGLALRRSKAGIETRIAWIAYLALVAGLSEIMWYEDFGFLRISSELFAVGALVMIGARSGFRWAALVLTFVMWEQLARDLTLHIR